MRCENPDPIESKIGNQPAELAGDKIEPPKALLRVLLKNRGEVVWPPGGWWRIRPGPDDSSMG